MSEQPRHSDGENIREIYLAAEAARLRKGARLQRRATAQCGAILAGSGAAFGTPLLWHTWWGAVAGLSALVLTVSFAGVIAISHDRMWARVPQPAA